jgi:hypothetical protein
VRAVAARLLQQLLLRVFLDVLEGDVLDDVITHVITNVIATESDAGPPSVTVPSSTTKIPTGPDGSSAGCAR